MRRRPAAAYIRTGTAASPGRSLRSSHTADKPFCSLCAPFTVLAVSSLARPRAHYMSHFLLVAFDVELFREHEEILSEEEEGRTKENVGKQTRQLKNGAKDVQFRFLRTRGTVIVLFVKLGTRKRRNSIFNEYWSSAAVQGAFTHTAAKTEGSLPTTKLRMNVVICHMS